MREPVTKPKSALLAGAACVALGVAYFALLRASDFPDPGANSAYDVDTIAELDNVPADYDEAGAFSVDLVNPRALASAGNQVLVGGENAIVTLNDAGQEVRRYAIEGTPTCLAVHEDGTLYAGLRQRVIVLDATGTKTAEWTNFTPRSYLTAIAVRGDDVYVADAGDRVVLRFDRTGTVLTRIGEKDPARDVPGLEVPSPYLDIAINEDGDLWVVNPGELGLERYRSDGSIVTSWYRPSLQLEGFSGCCNPAHIAFAPGGDLITCEKGLVRVKHYEVTAGAYLGLVAGSKMFPGEHSLRDITVDVQNRVWVLDGDRRTVRVFTRKEQDHGTTS